MFKCDSCRLPIEYGHNMFKVFIYLVIDEDDFEDETLVGTFCSIKCLKKGIEDESN